MAIYAFVVYEGTLNIMIILWVLVDGMELSINDIMQMYSNWLPRLPFEQGNAASCTIYGNRRANGVIWCLQLPLKKERIEKENISRLFEILKGLMICANVSAKNLYWEFSLKNIWRRLFRINELDGNLRYRAEKYFQSNTVNGLMEVWEAKNPILIWSGGVVIILKWAVPYRIQIGMEKNYFKFSTK